MNAEVRFHGRATLTLAALLSLPTSASCAVATSTLVPRAVETSSSLLVVVTGVWENTGSDSHEATLLYLDTILNNYVMACEVGFNVKVVLATYKPSPRHTSPSGQKSWDDLVDFERYFCQRIEASIDVSVESFENRGLPPGGFGTAGDLAFRHRDIFMRELNNFDLFLVQEDDIDVQPRTLLYAERWIRRFHGTPFWPALLDSEVVKHHRFASWRTNMLDLFHFQNEVMAKIILGPESTGRSYMITSQMLRKVDAVEWTDPRRFQNDSKPFEFNPLVASSNVLTRLGKTMVLPLQHNAWLDSFVAHLPNKYLRMAPPEARNAPAGMFVADQFSSLRVLELQAVFNTCLRNNTPDASVRGKSTADNRKGSLSSHAHAFGKLALNAFPFATYGRRLQGTVKQDMVKVANVTSGPGAFDPYLTYKKPSCFERLRRQGVFDSAHKAKLRIIMAPDRGFDLAPRQIAIRFETP